MMDKKEARVLAKRLRKDLNYDKDIINESLKPYLLDGMTVGIYYPLIDEIDLLFLEELYPNISFVYPKVIGPNMEFKTHEGGFEVGSFNVKEPVGKTINKDDIDLIITPALAVNKDLYRLGYGKGYYDAYLKDFKNKTLVIISKSLVLDFKEENHDVRIKEVIYL